MLLHIRNQKTEPQKPKSKKLSDNKIDVEIKQVVQKVKIYKKDL